MSGDRSLVSAGDGGRAIAVLGIAGLVVGVRVPLTALTESPQVCSLKFPT
jgi:hypothetical protein